jgi:hypothetical protein
MWRVTNYTHKVLCQKLRVAQLVKKFPVSYRCRKLLIVLTTTWHRYCPEPGESGLCFHILLKIHFYIILQSTPTFPNWSLSFEISYKVPATFLAQLILLLLIIPTTGDSTHYEDPRFSILLLYPPTLLHMFPSATSQLPPVHAFPLTHHIQFHTPTKQVNLHGFVYCNFSVYNVSLTIVSHIKGRAQAEGVCEQKAVENIWT